MTDKECKTCHYWRKIAKPTKEEDAGLGFCYRYPPKAGDLRLHPSQWCGEWKKSDEADSNR